MNFKTTFLIVAIFTAIYCFLLPVAKAADFVIPTKILKVRDVRHYIHVELKGNGNSSLKELRASFSLAKLKQHVVMIALSDVEKESNPVSYVRVLERYRELEEIFEFVGGATAAPTT